MDRVCRKCGESKPIYEFGRDSRKSDGKMVVCKKCWNLHQSIRSKQQRREDPDGVREKERVKRQMNREAIYRRQKRWRLNNPRVAYLKQIRLLYGLTEENFDRLLQDQGGRCAICNNPAREVPRGGLMVDHDHRTGFVRGLLCPGCNYGIGFLADNVCRLQAAIVYLSNPPFWGKSAALEESPRP